MILYAAIHEKLKFISFLLAVWAPCQLLNTRRKTHLLNCRWTFHLCLLFCVYHLNTWGGAMFQLTLPHRLSMGPFRKDHSSTDWNIISFRTNTLELLKRAPCSSLTTPLLYLLLTLGPLVQYTHGISLQRAKAARGINVLAVFSLTDVGKVFNAEILLQFNTNIPKARTWHVEKESRKQRKTSSVSEPNN